MNGRLANLQAEGEDWNRLWMGFFRGLPLLVNACGGFVNDDVRDSCGCDDVDDDFRQASIRDRKTLVFALERLLPSGVMSDTARAKLRAAYTEAEHRAET